MRRAIPWLLILPFIILYTPATSLAETFPNGTTTAPGAVSPTGADASTYKYNAATGQWENDHYIWNPATHQTTPKDSLTFSYNPSTGMWDTTEWIYNAAAGKYEPRTKSVAQVPIGAATIGGPTPAKLDQPQSPSGGAEQTEPVIQPGPKPSTNSTFNGFYNANISNTMVSSAKSGDANVVHNTTAGNASSGGTYTAQTILNLLQSTATLGDLNKVAAFTTNIDGDVVGDLHIDPSALGSLQPANSSAPTPSITVNTASNNSINDSIVASAQSGDANVSGNTTAGNATTGNASATINLINLLNSTIATGQSFIGLLNINGNLNGDILLPPNAISALLAAGASSAQAGSLSIADTSNQDITNEVAVSAATGLASVASNTTAGNATSGSAATKLTVLNLTGREVVGTNSLFVFINVLGQWVGAIFDAPQGSAAALLGGGITQDKTSSLLIHDTSNSTIHNDVTASAQSGNAAVNHNTTAGNATSGNATATANIANISNSSLSVSDWFGILFINVFGTWNGSFGMDTDAGNAFNSPVSDPIDQRTPDTPRGAPQPRVLRFTAYAAPAPGKPVQKQDNDLSKSKVLGITNSGNKNGPKTILSPAQHDINLAAGAVVVGAILVGIERALAYRDRQRHM